MILIRSCFLIQNHQTSGTSWRLTIRPRWKQLPCCRMMLEPRAGYRTSTCIPPSRSWYGDSKAGSSQLSTFTKLWTSHAELLLESLSKVSAWVAKQRLRPGWWINGSKDVVPCPPSHRSCSSRKPSCKVFQIQSRISPDYLVMLSAAEVMLCQKLKKRGYRAIWVMSWLFMIRTRKIPIENVRKF